MKDNKFFTFDHSGDAYKEPIKIYWLFLLPLCILVIDICYVIYIPGGLQKLQQTFNNELIVIQQVTSDNAIVFIYKIIEQAYQIVFVKSGIYDAYMSLDDELSRTMIDAMGPVIQASIVGFKLFMLRIAICILLLPFILLVFTAAFFEGLYARQLRIEMGDRESGFIYHRTKRIIFWSLIAFWLVYIVPPIPMDPRFILPPFLFIMAISLRMSVKYFKKHL